MKTNILFLLMGCVGLAANAQPNPNAIGNRQPMPDMDERVLQENYRIAPTKEGFTAALLHPRSDIRAFAAIRLAANGHKDAVRPILTALNVETVEGTKIILATAAAKLGADEGVNALKNMCGDKNWSPTLRMVAAQSMVANVGGEECLPDILAVLRSSPDDPQAANMALNLLAMFKQIPPSQLNESRDVGDMYLKSRAPALRTAASHFVRVLGGPWAISELQNALQIESDEAVRRVMAADLSSILQ